MPQRTSGAATSDFPSTELRRIYRDYSLKQRDRARIHSISLCLTIARGYCVIASRLPEGLTLRLATNQLTIGHTCNNCDYTWNDRDYTRNNGAGKLLCHGKQLDALCAIAKTLLNTARGVREMAKEGGFRGNSSLWSSVGWFTTIFARISRGFTETDIIIPKGVP